MNEALMNYFIKTECGLEKYNLLKSQKGMYATIRFYWFVFFASIRDVGYKRKVEKKLKRKLNNRP